MTIIILPNRITLILNVVFNVHENKRINGSK